MTSSHTSSAEFFTLAEREEMRFLRSLKGELLTAVSEFQEQDDLTREQAAERLGYDPAQLSRLVSPDRHNNTVSLFKIMFRLGRRWTFSSTPLPGVIGSHRNQAAENSLVPPIAAQAQQATISAPQGASGLTGAYPITHGNITPMSTLRQIYQDLQQLDNKLLKNKDTALIDSQHDRASLQNTPWQEETIIKQPMGF